MRARAKAKLRADGWVQDLMDTLRALDYMNVAELREVKRRLQQGYASASFGDNAEFDTFVQAPTLSESDVFLTVLGSFLDFRGGHDDLEAAAKELGCQSCDEP